MTQPSILPRFATDTNYATGPATGTPTKVDRGAGARAAGLIPGQRILAQCDNHEKHLVGEHLRSAAALAVDNWGPQQGNGTEEYRLSSASPPGRMFSIGSRLGWSVGNTGDGPFAYSDHNGENWTNAGTSGLGFSDWSICWPDGIGTGTRVLFGRISTGTIYQTTDFGANWTTGGTVAFNSYSAGGYFAAASLWIIVGQSGGDNLIQVDGNLSGAWTTVVPPAAVLADTNVPLDLQMNSSEILIPFSNGYVLRSTNGTAFTAVALPNYSGSIVGVSWSEAHSLWTCLGTAGKTWYSSDGAAWSEGTVVSGTFTAGGRVAALGRYWLAGESTGIARWDREERVIVPELLGADAGSAPLDLYVHRGRAVASRCVAAAPATLSFKRSLRVN